MKRENPRLSTALLLGLFGNVLLCSQTAYWTRIGLLLLPACCLVLSGIAAAFAVAWRQVGDNRLLRRGWLLILVVSSALELLRMWRLVDTVYPDSLRLLGVCIMLLAPVIYLRRVSSIAQTANVVLAFLLAAGCVMVLSIASDLHVANLQTPSLSTENICDALRGQLVLYPELLLPALWPEHDECAPRTAVRLAGGGLAFSVGVHLVLELFFGAGMPTHANPVHAAAQSGTLSLFARLEWLQLVLWSMIVTIKLAIYLYAGIRLLGGRTCKGENNAVGLDRFPFYFVLILLTCMVFRQTNLAAFWQVRNLAMAGFACIVLLKGGIRWLFKSCTLESS